MTKEQSLNEKEQRAAVHAALLAKGIKVTKTLVDQVLDTSADLLASALTQGMAIKFQGIGTIQPSAHKATTFKVPVLDSVTGLQKMVTTPETDPVTGVITNVEVIDATTGLPTPLFREGVVPAQLRVTFVESDVLLESMNSAVFTI